MKIFVDTANLTDIEEALKRGFARGVTTNPSLLAKEPKAKFEEHIGKIVDLIQKHQPGISLSVEVFSTDPKKILEQAKHFKTTFGYDELAIKVQVGWHELEVIRQLAAEGISVNCTCAMTVSQAVMAAASGARYVSLFWARIRDGGADPASIVAQTRAIFDRSYPKTEIIAGSMRSVDDIVGAGNAGAHIVTVPPKFFPAMMTHPKTDEVVQQFLRDFSAWMQ